METINHFFIRFDDILSGNYASLDSFKLLTAGQVSFFIDGTTYNMSPNQLFENYLKLGWAAFKVVDGDFLIVIVENQTITIVRDRHGAGKQIFYSDKYCTSHLNSFLPVPGFTPEPNIEGLFTFLSIGYIPSPQTSLLGIKKLPAGHVLTIDHGDFKTTDLFDFNDFINSAGSSKLSIDEAVVEYENLHQKSIENRVKNVGKVGLLLSGGYDSGGNISKLRDVYQGDVVSYSIGFKDNPWTELPLARILADRYQSKHFDYEIDGSEILALPQIVDMLGDPFQEGGLMLNYSAMKLVKETGENPAIILGGDGNDQHFGTSGKELALNWKLKKQGLSFFQKIYDKLGNLDAFDNDNILFRTQFHNRKILHIQQSDTFGFTKHQVNKLNSIGFKVPAYEYLKYSPLKYSDFDEFFYCRNFLIDIKQVINEVILFKASKMAQMYGNKISFPYMSTELYNFLKELPVGHKFHGTIDELAGGKGKSKYLHKKYLEPKLPGEITNRKKQGGFAPLPIFLRNDNQRKIVFDFIKKSDATKLLFERTKIDELLLKYDKLTTQNGYWFWYQQVQANKIINLLSLAVWWEMVINKKSNAQSIMDLS
jgi:asparagine synthase (glutamine-hydrolysing)